MEPWLFGSLCGSSVAEPQWLGGGYSYEVGLYCPREKGGGDAVEGEQMRSHRLVLVLK